MKDEEKDWQLFVEEQREEWQQKKPDSVLQNFFGCLIGGLLGPLLLIGSLLLVSMIRPDQTSGSPIFFLYLLLAVPIGGMIGVALSSSVMRFINSFKRNNRSR